MFMKIFSSSKRPAFSSGGLKATPLLSRHQALKGKLVPFAGYELPVMYDGKGIMHEHNHCRNHASVFDVSHMGQVCCFSNRPLLSFSLWWVLDLLLHICSSVYKLLYGCVISMLVSCSLHFLPPNQAYVLVVDKNDQSVTIHLPYTE
jgi:hypothetical protein